MIIYINHPLVTN